MRMYMTRFIDDHKPQGLYYAANVIDLVAMLDIEVNPERCEYQRIDHHCSVIWSHDEEPDEDRPAPDMELGDYEPLPDDDGWIRFTNRQIVEGQRLA